MKQDQHRVAVGKRLTMPLAWMVCCGPAAMLPRALAQGETSALAVEVVRPARRHLVRELKVPATLEPDEQVDLYAKVSGYVGDIEVDIGSRVKKGAALLSIDVPEMADELRQAQAVLEAKQAGVRALEAKAVQAQRAVDISRAQVRRFAAQYQLDQLNLTRKQELRQGNAIPEQALDEARSAHAIAEAQLHIAEARVAGAEAEKQAVDADVQVARAEVMVAQADLGRLKTLMRYAVVTAPFDGVITIRNVDRGAFVRSATEGAATTLLHIANTDRIRVALDVSETDASYLRIGTEVEMAIRAMGARRFPATVSRISGAVSPATRTMRVEIDLDNSDGRFTPGMYAQVTLKLESKADALVIPSRAVRVAGHDTVVFLAVNGVAESRPVTIGYDDGIWAEIVAGLGEEALVITSAGGAVTPGLAVAPVQSGS